MYSSIGASLQVTLCSPQGLLQIILQDVFLLQEDFFEKSFPCIHPTHISVLKSRLQNSKSLLKRSHKAQHPKVSPLIYLSAVPHQIGVYANICAADVAEILAAQISTHLSRYKSNYAFFQISVGLMADLLNHIDIQATPSGYLEFSIGESAIADWLNDLTQPTKALFVSADPRFSLADSPRQSPLPKTPLFAKRSHPNLFPIQYAHARCCSLLHLATQHQMIELIRLEYPFQLQWTQPNPISWLTIDQQLCTNHAAERQLINQCFTVLDELPWLDKRPRQVNSLHNPSQQLLHRDRITILAQDLAQAFHTMHQQCQIWGALQNEGSDRLTAHLALILVTQKLLYGLLQFGLGETAPRRL